MAADAQAALSRPIEKYDRTMQSATCGAARNDCGANVAVSRAMEILCVCNF